MYKRKEELIDFNEELFNIDELPIVNTGFSRKYPKLCRVTKLELKQQYNRYKQSALKRDLEYSLTLDQYTLLTDMSCYYCKDKPKKYNGIDRVDNAIGYTLDNSVPCCEECNFMKGKININNFVNRCLLIVENFRNQNTVKPGAGIMTPA